MDDKLTTRQHPTISLLAIILLFVGLGLGAFGATWKFKDTYPEVHQPEKLTACAGEIEVHEDASQSPEKNCLRGLYAR